MEDVENIGSVMDSVIQDMGMGKRLKKSNIFNHWEDIAGREIAKRARPRKLANMTLYISVTSSTWANELSLMSEELVKKINSFAGEEIVKTVRFKADL